MKWNRKPLHEHPGFNFERRRCVFAFWPVRTMDGFTVWLEFVVRVDVFRNGYDCLPGGQVHLARGWWLVGYETA
jgi:hypothetical protein